MPITEPGDRGASESNVGEDVFGDAFEKAEQVGDGEKEVQVPEESNELESKETPEPVVETPVEEPDEDPFEQTKDSSLQQPGESDEKYEQRYKTLQGIHRHDKVMWETEKADLLAKLDELKKEPSVPGKKETAEDPYDALSDEEKAQLKEYDEDFDVVSKMEGKKRAVELSKLRKEFQALKDEISSQLEPTSKVAEEYQQERAKRIEVEHFSSIRENHPDFEKYRDDGSIIKWIETKPKYIQKGMLDAYKSGTADDVVELISDFKTENEIQDSQPGAQNVVKINTKKAERKQAMTAVTTRRGAVNAAMTVANDYDGAWDEAMNKQGG